MMYTDPQNAPAPEQNRDSSEERGEHVPNPNPRANENLPKQDTTSATEGDAAGDVGSEITDGEDA